MDYCFRFALAAGFLALPFSLFAEEQGSPGSGDHRPPAGQEQLMRQKRQQLEAKLKELKQQHPQLTQEQKEKIKAAMQQMEQKRKENPELAQQHREKMKAEMEKRKEHHQEMKAKLEDHKQEMQTKLANWQENHPNDTPPAKHPGEPRKQQFSSGAKGQGERPQGGHGGDHK